MGKLPGPMYALSSPSCDLTEFLSHSWHAPAKLKVAALYVYYNGDAAVYAGLFMSVVGILLSCVGGLPAWGPDTEDFWLSPILPEKSKSGFRRDAISRSASAAEFRLWEGRWGFSGLYFVGTQKLS